MRQIFIPLGLAALLGACGYVDRYEEAVHDWEPTYCYKSIGSVACFREPYHRDERRLVNYFGPHPSRYDKPEPPTPAPHAPPEMVNYWVKDAEPIPRPAPTGKASNLAWLDPARVREDAARIEFARLSRRTDGTEALLKNMGIGPHGELRGEIAPLPARANGPGANGARPGDSAANQVNEPETARAEPEAPVLPAAPPAVPVPPVFEVDVN